MTIAALPSLPPETAKEQVTTHQERRPTWICPGAPSHRLRGYPHADDFAIVHADEDWQEVEGVMSKDMATVGE